MANFVLGSTRLSYSRPVAAVVAVLLSTAARSYCQESYCPVGYCPPEDVTSMDQEDERLVEIVRRHYLFPPSKEEYNFSRPFPPRTVGQFDQPMEIDNIFNNSLSGGFFIEAGAWDGEDLSNSLHFEIVRNWTGLLVEPVPEGFKMLQWKHRKSWTSPACFSPETHPVQIEMDVVGALSGIEYDGKKAADHDQRTVENYVSFEGKRRRSIKMMCYPLYTFLLALDNPTVHYLSLDIEGSEYQVLKTIPWDKVDIRVLEIEVNHAGKIFPGSRADIGSLLMANGYEHVGLLGIDDVFVKKDAVHVTDSLKSYMRQLRLPQFFLDKEDLELYFDTESINHDEL